ncbi:MAG TPA: amidohydrolase family protein [Tepidisphaeraceae bacterium]|nr:amidohydrolase family protein [Tepidisphaeraceae bacterium]
MGIRIAGWAAVVGCTLLSVWARAEEEGAAMATQAEQWRREHRLIDLHQHIDFTPAHLARAVKIMDAVGIGTVVNLGSGTVTRGPQGEASEFERAKQLTDGRYPGRFLHYMMLDYRGWDEPDFAERAVKQIEEGHRLGAAGLKEFKRLGLFLRDGTGKLIRIDDPKLDPVWKRCGELNMPVSIHVGDPKAFWLPFNETNERWKELRDHRDWWFGDSAKYPQWKELLEALNRVMGRHGGTTFVCVHFGNNAEELEWVERSLSRYPNMMVDLAARIPELGRHDPEQVRKMFLKYQDRILFGTDFLVYGRLILGSSGNEPAPTDRDAEVFFAKHWRWLETRDRDWAHMTPIQGDWTISSIGLPESVLRKIYFDNARKLVARSLPAPVMKAARIEKDFEVDGDLGKAVWQKAEAVRLEYTLKESAARPGIATRVRCLWSADYLYFSYECPFTRLTTFEPVIKERERLGLWDRDVVEAFVGTDAQNIGNYAEFEVAPTNERLDVLIRLPGKDFEWSSGFTSAVRIDEQAKVWTAEVRIPLAALSKVRPEAGTRWRLDLFRSDRAQDAFLAWNPTLTESTHTPGRFGVLEFGR